MKTKKKLMQGYKLRLMQECKRAIKGKLKLRRDIKIISKILRELKEVNHAKAT